jgi:3-oxoacyl-[acyl-carrier protein] reductase
LAVVVAEGLRHVGETAVPLASEPTSGDEVAVLLAKAEAEAGPLHGVVLVSAGRAASEEGDLAALDPAQWRRRVEEPLARTVAIFQGAHRRLRPRGGGIVVLVPTLGLVGAPGFAPWATVAEGQRSLAKAAARAWGPEAITVNCLAVPGALLLPPGMRSGPPGGSGRGPDRRGQPPPSLPRSPDLFGAVAPVVASLLSGPWTAVTGATIDVDGGVAMTP